MQPSAQTSNFKRWGFHSLSGHLLQHLVVFLVKLFYILAGLNFQCCKFYLLPVILPLLKRLLFPSSLQPPVNSRRHQVSPQAFSFQLNKLFSHSLPLHHVSVRLSSDFWCFSCTGSPKFGTVLQQWSHRGCTQGTPASALLLMLPRLHLGCSGGFSTSRAHSLIQFLSSPNSMYL